MFRRLSFSAIIIFSFLGIVVNAEEWKEASPRICLVLKGGGALGFAHVGVLKVLEENKIPIHCIAGTSMGSIVGAAYATGNSMPEILDVVTKTDWGELFGEKVQRSNLDYRNKAGRERELYGDLKISISDGKLKIPTGIVEGQNIRPLFQKLFSNLSSPINFDTLPIPFRAATTDLETGATYVPESGDLATVVRASMSVPGAFAPVELDGKILVDGGLTDNLPVDVALKLGADVLIVVDLKSKLAERKDLQSPFSISGQFVSMLLMQNAILSKKLIRENDVVIEPDVSKYTVTDFGEATKIAEVGETAAREIADSFQHLALSDEDYQKYQERRQKKIVKERRIDFIRVKNDSKISDKRLVQESGIKTGTNLDIAQVEEGLGKLYQSGYFTSVQYSILDEPEETGVLLDFKAKSWLDEYIRLGFALEDNLDGDDSFRLATAYRTVGLTKSGYSEIQTEIGKTPQLILEHYQLLNPESQYFFNPLFRVGRTDLIVSQGGEQVAEYQREAGSGVFAFGRRLGTVGEFATFLRRGWGSLEREIGDPTMNDLSYDQGDLGLNLTVDTLDKPDFPTQGVLGTLNYYSSLDELGASDNFESLVGIVNLPFTSGRNTVVFKNSFGHSFSELPLDRYYSLGGFLSVSGSTINSLSASDFFTNQLLFFHRFSEEQNPFLDLAYYLGGSIESSYLTSDNEVIEDLDGITSASVLFGADTPLLPFYLSYGFNDNQDHSIYINFGRIGRSRSGY